MCIKVYNVATVCAHKECSVKHYCEAYTKVRQTLHQRNCDKRIVMELLPGWCSNCAKEFGKRGLSDLVPIRSRDALARYWGFKARGPYAYPIPSTTVPTDVFTDHYVEMTNFVPFQPDDFEDSQFRWEESALLFMVLRKRPSVVKFEDTVLKVQPFPERTLRLNIYLHELIHKARDGTIEWSNTPSREKKVAIRLPRWDETKFEGASRRLLTPKRTFESAPFRRDVAPLTEDNVAALGLSGYSVRDFDSVWASLGSSPTSSFDSINIQDQDVLPLDNPQDKGKQRSRPPPIPTPIHDSFGNLSLDKGKQPVKPPLAESMRKPLPALPSDISSVDNPPEGETAAEARRRRRGTAVFADRTSQNIPFLYGSGSEPVWSPTGPAPTISPTNSPLPSLPEDNGKGKQPQQALPMPASTASVKRKPLPPNSRSQSRPSQQEQQPEPEKKPARKVKVSAFKEHLSSIADPEEAKAIQEHLINGGSPVPRGNKPTSSDRRGGQRDAASSSRPRDRKPDKSGRK